MEPTGKQHKFCFASPVNTSCLMLLAQGLGDKSLLDIALQECHYRSFLVNVLISCDEHYDRTISTAAAVGFIESAHHRALYASPQPVPSVTIVAKEFDNPIGILTMILNELEDESRFDEKRWDEAIAVWKTHFLGQDYRQQPTHDLDTLLRRQAQTMDYAAAKHNMDEIVKFFQLQTLGHMQHAHDKSHVRTTWIESMKSLLVNKVTRQDLRASSNAQQGSDDTRGWERR